MAVQMTFLQDATFTTDNLKNVTDKLIAVLEKKTNKYVTKREMFYITMHALYGDKAISTHLSDEQISNTRKFGNYFAKRFMLNGKNNRLVPNSEIMTVLYPQGCRYINPKTGVEYNLYRNRIYNVSKNKTKEIESSTCGRKSGMRTWIDDTLTFTRSL